VGCTQLHHRGNNPDSSRAALDRSAGGRRGRRRLIALEQDLHEGQGNISAIGLPLGTTSELARDGGGGETSSTRGEGESRRLVAGVWVAAGMRQVDGRALGKGRRGWEGKRLRAIFQRSKLSTGGKRL
jgi:hypothetical protein